ncbi:MAG TPA: UDP-N-acetylmuramoyl-L-alanine--D-glutamate ligase [Cytophagaceae bacterium]|jgi:UDP-N-acetylmuramoylalanine--D-glutamate ligase|nr:UDP-N-acetylmuramoyl-L-alanine--D-glutamate ligase [Cytophagaceae bacterium]
MSVNNKIVVLGAAESGVGAALLAKAKGFDVFISDSGKIADSFKKKLEDNSISYEEGQHTEEKIFSTKEIIKSPGISDKSELIKKAKKNKIKIISEIEFAGRYTKGKKICITGTNGKTTTTLLTFHLLKKAGWNVALAGNIGNSFAELVIEDKYDAYVLELSSFQLDGMFKFKADIAVLTNITPDHLDRYDYKVENYVKSKFRVIQNMDAEGTFIYGEDSELLFDELFDIETVTQELPFSIEETEGVAAWGDEQKFWLDPKFDIASDGHNPADIIEINNSLSVLKGKHNLYNAMAASLVAARMGVKKEIIQEGLSDFVNAAHRMEFVAEIDGIKFVNDSKATNVDSAYYALDAIKEPIVWIAGGVDKGNDYSALNEVVKGKVKVLVCLGKENGKLVNAFKNIIPIIIETQEIEACAKICLEKAVAGDVVLLSPCCASFDLFKNYEDRGDKFKQAVKQLIFNNSRIK